MFLVDLGAYALDGDIFETSVFRLQKSGSCFVCVNDHHGMRGVITFRNLSVFCCVLISCS